MDKKELRRQMLRMRDALSPSFSKKAAERACALAVSLEAFRQAKTVMLYCDYKNEMGTDPLLMRCLEGKKTVLPFTNRDFCIHPYYLEKIQDLALSNLGIREPDPTLCPPCSPDAVDLIFVPGVAFDISGRRLGYGKGCYDRFLPLLRRDVPVIGLAYDFQVLPSLPAEAHDLSMDAIITEKGLLSTVSIS